LSVSLRHLSNAQRRITWVSPNLSRAATGNNVVAFATGSFKARITKIIYQARSNFTTSAADIIISVGTFSEIGQPANFTKFSFGKGFLNANKSSKVLTVMNDVVAGVTVEHNISQIVGPFTVVRVDSTGVPTAVGDFFIIIQYEILDPNPQEVGPA